jgi:phosphoesterase RecJ-like protein
MSKSETIEEILMEIKKHETFLISSHINSDGDSIGSQLAFYSFLSELGKKVYIINTESVPARYRFLPNSGVIQTQTDLNNSGLLNNLDAVITLDSGSLNRIGETLSAQISPESVIINIDHHSSNEYFGAYNLVDTNACATGELVFKIIKHSGMAIGYDRAVCLYTAILTDTGCFKFTNTTINAHLITAQLIEEGVQPEHITELVYDIVPYKKAKLFGMSLETLKISHDSRIGWMSVTNEMYKRTQTEAEDTEGFIDYVRSLENVEVALFFRETENGNTKVSLRSKNLSQNRPTINVNDIATDFGGGGHIFAAGCSISKPMNEAIEAVLERIRKVMN